MEQWLGEILFWGLVVAAGIQVVFYAFVFMRVPLFRKKQEGPTVPVSVVIAARNEAENLQRFLPTVLAQKEVEFEVIVVDDCSVDSTSEVLIELAKKYPRLSHTRLRENGTFTGGKKYALTLGIKAAKYEHLVFTDADCEPASDRWLFHMASAVAQRPLVLGYGPHMRGKGLLNKLIRFDTFQIGVQYISFALAGLPYMGVGRNMAYRSYLFFNSDGFSRHYDIPSGDDDLFVNQVAKARNVEAVLEPEAYTYSPAKTTWKGWVRQKKRHIQTSVRYRPRHLLAFFLLTGSQYIVFGLFVALWLIPWRLQEALIVFGSRYLIQQVMYLWSLKKTRETDLWPIALFFEPFYLLFYPALVFIRLIERSNEWKR